MYFVVCIVFDIGSYVKLKTENKNKFFNVTSYPTNTNTDKPVEIIFVCFHSFAIILFVWTFKDLWICFRVVELLVRSVTLDTLLWLSRTRRRIYSSSRSEQSLTVTSAMATSWFPGTPSTVTLKRRTSPFYEVVRHFGST